MLFGKPIITTDKVDSSEDQPQTLFGKPVVMAEGEIPLSEAPIILSGMLYEHYSIPKRIPLKVTRNEDGTFVARAANPEDAYELGLIIKQMKAAADENENDESGY